MRAPTLVDGTVTLRAWRGSDAKAYVAGRDEEVFRWTTEPRELSPDRVQAAIAEVHAAPDMVGFAITHEPDDDVPVGNLAVVIRGDVAEVSYWLSPQVRGKGLARAALNAVCAWLESRSDISRIEAVCHPGNAASQQAARSAGFIDAGLRRSDAPYAQDGLVAVLVRETV